MLYKSEELGHIVTLQINLNFKIGTNVGNLTVSREIHSLKGILEINASFLL